MSLPGKSGLKYVLSGQAVFLDFAGGSQSAAAGWAKGGGYPWRREGKCTGKDARATLWG